MRFTELHMRPFGTFEDFTLDFALKTGLHVVFGTNGAGKSTTLEALRFALYGIDARNKVHASSDLRIGARLQRGDGEAIEFMRRTSQKTPLWTLDDSEPLPPESLSPFLGNLDKERYQTLFGLDYATMVAGGQDILEGQGEIGRALFGAMLGGQRLAEVTGQLDDEIRELWVERSSKSKLAGLSKEHARLTAELKKAAMRPRDHKSDQRELASLVEEQSRAREERRAAREDADGLLQLQTFVKALDQLDQKRKERAELGTFAPLDPPVARRALDYHQELEALGSRADERAKELHGLEEQRAEARANARPALLESAAEIEALNQRQGAFREAAEAAAQLATELQDAEAKRAKELDEAPTHGEEAEAAETLERALKGPAASDLDSLSEAADRLSTRLAKVESERAMAKKEYLTRYVPRTKAAAARWESIDETLHSQLTSELEDLAPFKGTLRELEALTVPDGPAIDRRMAQERREGAELQEFQTELRGLERDLASASRTEEQLRSAGEGALPTSEEIAAARDARDALLARVFDPGGPSPTAALELQKAMHDADHLMDQRARQATRAAELDGLKAEGERLRERMGEVRALIATAEARAQSTETAWVAAWTSAGFRPLDAASMQAWVERRRSLLRTVGQRREEAEATWRHALAEEEERRGLLENAESAWQEASSQWVDWANGRHLDPAAGPEAAQRRLRLLVGVRTADKDIARLRAELEKRALTASEFEQDVAALCRVLSVRPKDSVLEDALSAAEDATARERVLAESRLAELQHALKSAHRTQATLEEVETQINKLKEAAALNAKRSGELQSSLEELAAAAGAEDVDVLWGRAQLSDRARALESDIETLEADLREVSAGRTAEELKELLGERSAGELALELDAARKRAALLDEGLDEHAKAEGQLRARLEASGSSDAVHTQSRIAEVEAEMAELTERYVRARLAQQILHREVERHRLETQGPLLARAQSLFQTLTLGAYERLHPSEDQRGKQVMVARRPDGRQVGVTEMSSGTRDQLYLALRIASVEHMLKTTGPMPFIADDLFVNFDDQRTEAALRVLAELAKSTQVIVFSHHESVVATTMRLRDEGVSVDVVRLTDERTREAREGQELAT